jgi:hypothetical protein
MDSEADGVAGAKAVAAKAFRKLLVWALVAQYASR